MVRADSSEHFRCSSLPQKNMEGGFFEKEATLLYGFCT
jgi:hypothetical protein